MIFEIGTRLVLKKPELSDNYMPGDENYIFKVIGYTNHGGDIVLFDILTGAVSHCYSRNFNKFER